MKLSKIVISVAVFLLFAITNAQENARLINQDANLYKVDENLYRSEQLIIEDKKSIAENDIKTIISLRYFGRHKNKSVFTEKDGIRLINNPLLTWRVNSNDIAQTLILIKQYQKEGNVLVHCYHGADRTGIMMAMYRIIYQNWGIDEAKKEMQQGPYGYHSIWKNLDKLFTEKTVNEVKNILKKERFL